MAQMTGYVCDVCEKFALKKTAWMSLTGGPTTQGNIDVCSNKCLVKLARQRLEAERDLNGEVKKSKPRITLSSDGQVISEDQKLEIVAEALELGVKATAEAHGIPWQAVAKWKQNLA